MFPTSGGLSAYLSDLSMPYEFVGLFLTGMSLFVVGSVKSTRT